MYETDLLLCIVFILLCAYVKTIVRDFLKHRSQFWNIKGPKSLPITLIAYLFTARSDAGKVSITTISRALISSALLWCNLIFQIAFRYSKVYRRNIHASTPSGSAQNTSLSLMIQASRSVSSPIPSAWRKTSSWNFSDFPTDWLRWNVSEEIKSETFRGNLNLENWWCCESDKRGKVNKEVAKISANGCGSYKNKKVWKDLSWIFNENCFSG